MKEILHRQSVNYMNKFLHNTQNSYEFMADKAVKYLGTCKIKLRIKNVVL